VNRIVRRTALAAAILLLAALASYPKTPRVHFHRTHGGHAKVQLAGGSGCYSPSKKERQFTSKMNSARQNNGKSTLILDPELSKAAFKHTREMTGRNTLYHTPSDDLRRRVTHWNTLGENVGVGGTVSSLHTAFMNSPAHRDNILYPSFRYVGVGTKSAGGRLWVTVIFEATSNPGSPLC
jgi:uncharacterized protein YkwD